MTKKIDRNQQETGDDKEINRREALRRLGQLAYTVPTLTVISLNTQADDGPNPPPGPPGSNSPLQR